MGTWTWTDPENNLVQTLTFTGGPAPRWIIHYAERDTDDTVTAMSVESGTWSVADGAVTRTWIDDLTTEPVHLPKLPPSLSSHPPTARGIGQLDHM